MKQYVQDGETVGFKTELMTSSDYIEAAWYSDEMPNK